MKTNDILWRDEDLIIQEFNMNKDYDPVELWCELLTQYNVYGDMFWDIR